MEITMEKEEQLKTSAENNSNDKQYNFEDELGLTQDEIKIIEYYRRLYTGTIIMGQYHTNVYEDLRTSLESYYEECLEHANSNSNPIQFKDWDDLSTIFNSEDKGVGTIFIFNHLKKIDNSIEERLKNTNKDGQLFKSLTKLENIYLELKKIVASRDIIKDLLIEIFENIPNYKEKQELISKLNENILVEASKITQVFQHIDNVNDINLKDIYGIDGNGPMANAINEIKPFQ